MSIVSVQRPQDFTASSRAGLAHRLEFIGDLLLPTNVRARTTSSSGVNTSECLTEQMRRLSTVVNNHIYMEHSLQPAYTAGLLYLLQAGVVRPVLDQKWTSQLMLAFEGKTQDVDVYVYIPSLNVLLTYAGCGVLVLAIAVVVLWPRGKTDPLAHITTPQTIARVLLNDNAFPTALLSRSVAPADARANNADTYQIQTLSLETKEERANRGSVAV